MSSTVTVLVVEDDADLREVVVSTIEHDGMRIVEAEDGREALDYILASGLPDLILLDMNMPVMNGWEFAHELHERGLYEAPIIVLTAAYDAERSAREVGAAGYLGKPFEVRSLVAIVERYCRARSERAQDSASR
jgi:CheY-like chemotaxis protein